MAPTRPDLKPYVGQQLTVIAWLWARTVRSPNPAYADVEVPLASSFMLSSKKGKEAWVEPVVEGKTYRFEVRTSAAGQGKPPSVGKAGTKLSRRRQTFRCLVSDIADEPDYIKAEGKAGRMGVRLMAVVAEGDAWSRLSRSDRVDASDGQIRKPDMETRCRRCRMIRVTSRRSAMACEPTATCSPHANWSP